MLKPQVFVIWLFIMAACCVVIALGDRSWGWLIGGIVFFAVAIWAQRLKNREQDDEDEDEESHTGPRLGFFAIAILVMMAAIYAIYWLSTAA